MNASYRSLDDFAVSSPALDTISRSTNWRTRYLPHHPGELCGRLSAVGINEEWVGLVGA